MPDENDTLPVPLLDQVSHALAMSDGPRKGIESLIGYLARVGSECGWGNAFRVAELAGLMDAERIWAPSEGDLALLSEYLGVPVSDLSELSWGRVGEGSSVKTLLNTWRARICPICLSNDQVLRREWEIAASTECAVHGVQLIDACHCNEPISVRRPVLDYCTACCEPISSTEAVASDPLVLPLSTSLANLAIAGRWGSRAAAGGSIIENIDYSALFQLSEYLSGLVLWLEKRTDHRNRTDVASCRQTLIDAAPLIVDGWPSGFVELIRRMERRESGSSDERVSTSFPYLFRSLYAGEQTPWRNQLQSVFEDYLKAERPELLLGLPSKHVLSKRLSLDKTYMTFRAAAAEIGTNWSAVARAVEELGLKPAIIKRSRTRTTQRISREQLGLVAAEVRRRPEVYLAKGPAAQRVSQGARRRFMLEAGVDMERAYGWFHDGRSFPSSEILARWPSKSLVAVVTIAKRLGVSPATATKLRDAGWFAPVDAVPRPRHAMLIEDYADFEVKLGELIGAKTNDVKCGRPLLEALDSTLKRYKVDLGGVLDLLVNKDLTIVGIDRRRRGLDRLLVSARDLSAVTDRIRKQRAFGRLGIMEVTAKLGLSDANIVSRLSQAGLLKAMTVDPGRTARKEFLLSDVEAFESQFIGFKEIARRHLFGRLSAPGASRSYLARKGVKPICGPDINGVPAVFFERAAVEGVSWFARDREE